MPWTTLTMQVTTPLFTGGAQPSDAGLRVPGLRGALRYWFRALAAPHIGTDINGLRTLEGAVFGNTDRQSPTAIRIIDPPEPEHLERPAWCRGPGASWIGYLAGQGLAKPADDGCRLRRSYIPAGSRFGLQLRFSDDDTATLTLAALWLLCRYGGLGARTRRGFGGLTILSAGTPLPGAWPALPDSRPTHHDGGILRMDEHGTPAELDGYTTALTRIAARTEVTLTPTTPGQTLPYPGFGIGTTHARLSGRTFANWTGVLAHAGEQYRWSRATVDTPDARYTPPIKTPEWLHVVHGHQRHFPLGALGLPVNFKQATVEPRQAGKPVRRASPLWIRPITDTNGTWRLLAHAFHNEFLPQDTTVQLRGQKTLHITQDDVRTRTTAWIDTMGSDGTYKRSAP